MGIRPVAGPSPTEPVDRVTSVGPSGAHGGLTPWARSCTGKVSPPLKAFFVWCSALAVIQVSGVQVVSPYTFFIKKWS